MINLTNDYSNIAHSRILDALFKYSNSYYPGYGLDEHSKKAADMIKGLLGSPDADIHFLMNGTGTNKVMLSHLLRPYQAVMACDTGHIAVHETGAIEDCGHKVITMPHKNGKLTPDSIKYVLSIHTDEHMVMPKVVYISNATETGSIYSYKELQELRNVCDEYALFLYMDGARLGVAMQCDKNDVKWSDLCKFFDAFYIGGTKNGALSGEAVVIVNSELKKDFRYSIKNKGNMYAKGFVAGIQFCELFKDNLYMQLADNSLNCANILKKGLIDTGYRFEYESDTNQLFVIVTKDQLNKLKSEISFETISKKTDGNIVIRLVTGYADKPEMMEKAVEIFRSISI